MQSWIWNVGWLLLAAVWFGPLPRLAETSFAAHMTLHMLIVAVVSPLLAIGVAGRRLDPVGRHPVFFAPIPAAIAELVIVWAWHAPSLHHFARHHTLGLILEQSMFLLAGVWVWLSAFGGTTSQRRSRAGAGVIGLLLTSMHMTFLGALLAMSPRLLYSHPHGSRGLPPLFEQHLGGAIMLVVGGISYLVGGLWLTKRLVASGNALQRPMIPLWNTER